jgi:prepilin-type N-terminal cleavage/methylation domain-containing protein
MRRQQPAGAAPEPDDAGFSLAEVLVTLGVMGVVMAIFTGGILNIYRTSTATEALSTAQTQLQLAFQRFDRELRYATWIAQPGQVGTAWYTEFAGPGATDCRQLRLETASAGGNGANGQGVLQLLAWTLGAPPAAGTPGQTIASQIVTTGVDPFFELQAANATPYASASSGVGTEFTSDFQRLRVRLTTRAAGGNTQIDTTFTALNTSRETKATNSCSEGRPH